MTIQKNVLIVGATGGIGSAILAQLVLDRRIKQIYATYRRHQPTTQPHVKVRWLKMEIADEDSIAHAIHTICHETSHLDWVINAVGVLHTSNHQPEKSSQHIQADFFLQNMTVNALGGMLLAKHIKPLIKQAKRTHQHPAMFATLSARVGSISDNRLGGWYSYRMSKAALNMGMKTLSIEWQRTLGNVCVTVMQPGTVDTPLSQPYQKNVAKDALFTPELAAKRLLTVLDNMTAEDTGSFVDWAGQPIPW